MKKYELKQSLKKGSIDKKKFESFYVMTISDIKVINRSKNTEEILPKGTLTICTKYVDAFYSNLEANGYCYDLAVIKLPKNYGGNIIDFLGNYIVSEKQINESTIIMSTLEKDKYEGVEIKKGFSTIYDSSKLFDCCGKINSHYPNMELDYVEYVDGPLKELFQFDRVGSNFFIEKTISVLKNFVNALKKAENTTLARNCLLMMNEYLQTTLKTISELADKTGTERVQIIRKKTKTERFLEDMKYRNEVIKAFHSC